MCPPLSNIWLALALFSLFLITYIPAISLFLPKLLYPDIN